MKQGLTLVEMAQAVQDQAEAKRDFVADTRSLEMNADGSITVESETVETFATTDHTHGQIAQRLSIPTKYYRRMQDQAPQLLAENVNHWFQNNPERRMIRTLEGRARAFLSDRYRRVDNFEIAETVLPVLSEFGDGLKIMSVGLTDSRLYIKAVNERIQLDVRKGDAVQAGVVISNSEIGLGSIRIEPLVYRLVCLNGMISQDHSFKKYHVGRQVGEDEAAMELFSDETMQADDKALLLKLRDMVRAASDIAKFTQIVERMREATERKIEGNPVTAVEVLGDKLSVNQEERSGILTHLIQGGDLSAYGMMNAVTRTSQDVGNYDRATELEAMGSQVLSLPQSSWKEIALAR
jgi:DNA-binding phage protein